MTGPARFHFVGVERDLFAAGDWNRGDWPKLWLYNAHYFDDLLADCAASRLAWHRGLMTRWIAENPPGKGNGWEPYPNSLRIVNWTKWALCGNALEDSTAHSLAVQVRYLRRRLEIHLLGNHLWANAKALVFAGAFFGGDEARRWREKGLALLDRELDEQVLADGGHFERSPMYHAVLLEDVLDLVQLAAAYPALFEDSLVLRWREAAQRMLGWLRVMTHPDGGIAFFNDATLGIAPSFDDLADHSGVLGFPLDQRPLRSIEAMQPSGYVRLSAGPAELIADVGEIGPDYLPGHAHADTLSFELSLHGHRLFVNGGTSTYEAGAERLRQRGTAAHNTVQLDDQDSSEVWSSFRVARRARPLDLSWEDRGHALALQASHDGYRRLRGRPVHRRAWQLSSTGLHVVDRIDGNYSRAVARFMLHPDWRATVDAFGSSGSIEFSGRRIRWSSEGGAVTGIAAGTWHPGFGRSVPCQIIEIAFSGAQLVTEYSWN